RPLFPSVTWLVGVIERITLSAVFGSSVPDKAATVAPRQPFKSTAPAEPTPAVTAAAPRNSRRLSFFIPLPPSIYQDLNCTPPSVWDKLKETFDESAERTAA